MRFDRQIAAVRTVPAALLAGLLVFAGSGCVSSTLDSRDFRPVGGQTATSQSATGQRVPAAQDVQSQALPVAPQDLAQTQSQVPSQVPPQASVSEDTATGSVGDPAKRQQAVDEIRAKAAVSSGQKTQIGAVPGAATEQMDTREQADIASKLDESRKAVGSELSDAEIEARQAAIRRLQKKGKTHYEQAVDAIEN